MSMLVLEPMGVQLNKLRMLHSQKNQGLALQVRKKIESDHLHQEHTKPLILLSKHPK